MIDRRQLVGGGALAALLGAATEAAAADPSRYGSVGKLLARPGQRAALAGLVLAGAADMPGCLHYFVAEDVADANALWVFEVWTSKAAHDASLALPAVKAAIVSARPLIAGFDAGAELNVIGSVATAIR